MLDRKLIQDQIVQLMADVMEIRVPAVDTDLFNEGFLDSLNYVELKQAFEVAISLGEVDVDQFRTVEQIAEVVISRQAIAAAV
jgi:acyl carrier protein